MDAQSRDVVTWILGTLLALGTLVAGLVRFMLLPYLREHLVEPVKATQAQVTENSHNAPHDSPTVMDRLDDVQTDVKAISHVMDVHMDWSERKVKRTDRKLKRLHRMIVERTEDPPHDTNPTP